MVSNLVRRTDAPLHRRGFTLIELLVVIAIIALLASLIIGGVITVQKKAKKTAAQKDLDYFYTALERYYSDHNFYPGASDAAEEEGNSFPALFNELYLKTNFLEDLKIQKIVLDEGDGPERYRVANADERADTSEPKYYLDPWGTAYVYRENLMKLKKEPWMINPKKYDIWSYGPNSKDESASAEFIEEKPRAYDDVGNWE